MFKTRYWREYPVFLQLLLLGLMMFSLFSFCSAIAIFLLPKMGNIQLADIQNLTEESSRNLVNAAFAVQLLAALGCFLLPALVFAYLTHPKPVSYLGLKKPGKPIQWLLVPMVMLGAIPLLLSLGAWFQSFDFGPEIKAMQERHDNQIKAMLKMSSFKDFLIAFGIMAVLPAFSEEMIFRGILMRIIHRRSQRIGIAIALSSLVFALVHYDPAGLTAIFCAAVLLGGIYYLTGSLWLSILAHLLNNGLQIIIMYFGANNKELETIMNGNTVPWQFPVFGAVIFILSFYLLWKNRTVMPDNWSDDFAGEREELNNTY